MTTRQRERPLPALCALVALALACGACQQERAQAATRADGPETDELRLQGSVSGVSYAELAEDLGHLTG